jgi:uncharacterized protein
MGEGMMRISFLGLAAAGMFLGSLTVYGGGPARTSDPCSGVSGWRGSLCTFTKNNLKHSAWGFAHSKRDYLVASELARNEGLTVDDDVLFAAGMLHDMGGFAPYAIAGVDHALRSTQIVDSVLKPAGFPMEKAEAVKKAILTHSYYCPDRPETPEALVFHDADTLDFMGDIGVMRIFSIVGDESGFPNVLSAFKFLKEFEASLFDKIDGGAYTKGEAKKRMFELSEFLKTLHAESYDLKNL